MVIEASTCCSKCGRRNKITNISKGTPTCLRSSCRQYVLDKFRKPEMNNCSYRIGSYSVFFNTTPINLCFDFEEENDMKWFGTVSKRGSRVLNKPPSIEFFESIRLITDLKGVKGLSQISVGYLSGKSRLCAVYSLATKEIEKVEIVGRSKFYE